MQNCEKRLLAVSCPSVRMPHLGSHWTDFDEIWYLSFFENLSRKFKFHYNPTRITGILHEDVFTFMTICRWVILIMRSISNKTCREKRNTHFMIHKFFENLAVYEIISKNLVEPGRPQTIWRMRVACWMCKATRAQAHGRAPTHTHVLTHACTHKYVRLAAFPGQQYFVNAPRYYVMRTLPFLL